MRVTSKAALATGTFCASADEAPSQPGAYVLAIELAESVTVALPGKPATILASGGYLYCGSACGPGGLRARLRRHMRRGKTVRWHVDRLTEAGTVLGAWIFRDGDECELAAALSSLPAPIAGFGSTDCPRCRGHLFRWPDAAGSRATDKVNWHTVPGSLQLSRNALRFMTNPLRSV
jgi:Uri superfamily endonuclease